MKNEQICHIYNLFRFMSACINNINDGVQSLSLLLFAATTTEHQCTYYHYKIK